MVLRRSSSHCGQGGVTGCEEHGVQGQWLRKKLRHREKRPEGVPWGSAGKEPACNVGDLGPIPGLGRSPGEGRGSPLQYSCLENPMDRGAWWAIVHGGQKRVGDTTQQLSNNTTYYLMVTISSCCTNLLKRIGRPSSFISFCSDLWELLSASQRGQVLLHLNIHTYTFLSLVLYPPPPHLDNSCSTFRSQVTCHFFRAMSPFTAFLNGVGVHGFHSIQGFPMSQHLQPVHIPQETVSTKRGSWSVLFTGAPTQHEE